MQFGSAVRTGSLVILAVCLSACGNGDRAVSARVHTYFEPSWYSEDWTGPDCPDEVVVVMQQPSGDGGVVESARGTFPFTPDDTGPVQGGDCSGYAAYELDIDGTRGFRVVVEDTRTGERHYCTNYLWEYEEDGFGPEAGCIAGLTPSDFDPPFWLQAWEDE